MQSPVIPSVIISVSGTNAAIGHCEHVYLHWVSVQGEVLLLVAVAAVACTTEMGGDTEPDYDLACMLTNWV